MTTSGITGMVNARAGIVPPPTATVQDVSQALRQTLEQLLQVKQTETVADAVKSLISKKEEGERSPFAGLKDLGIDVKSLLDANTNMTKVALDQLNKERERVLEEKEKALAAQKTERAQELSIAEKLMGLVINTQNRSYEQQLDLLKEMYKERIDQLKEAGKKPESDELSQFMKALSIKLLEEKLTRPAPDPRAEIRNYLEIARDLTNMLGMSRPDNSKAAELNYQIELKKIDLEASKLEKELEYKRQMEERKLATWNQFVQQLSQLVPAALQVLQARSQSPQPVNVAMPQRICPVCGEAIPVGAAKCPRCGQGGQDNSAAVGERVSRGEVVEL